MEIGSPGHTVILVTLDDDDGVDIRLVAPQA